MTELIIHGGVAIFGLCALSVILNHNIRKSLVAWVFLIGIVISSASMFISAGYYPESFASFSIFAAIAAVHFTKIVYRRGEV